mgnify:CR=1 FL=1
MNNPFSSNPIPDNFEEIDSDKTDIETSSPSDKKRERVEKAVNKAIKEIRGLEKMAADLTDVEKQKIIKAINREIGDLKKRLFDSSSDEPFAF